MVSGCDTVKFLFLYLVIINLLSVFVCIFDKQRAVKGGWRVPEKTLFFLCFMGGSILMLITMKTIRHKTLHKRFMLGIPLIIILQIALAILILSKIST